MNAIILWKRVNGQYYALSFLPSQLYEAIDAMLGWADNPDTNFEMTHFHRMADEAWERVEKEAVK